MLILSQLFAMTTPRCVALALVVSLAAVSSVHAQVVPPYSGHQPLSQRSSPGLAARFADVAGKTGYLQPIRVVLDDDVGEVSILHAPQRETALGPSAQTAVMVGHCYRMKISKLPGRPAVEIFPTIEVIDRLHPPAGQKDAFPIPIAITNEDIDAALEGNLVTRVVYLEQPQIAAPFELDKQTGTTQLLKADNAITEADRRGRPVVIVRIGGRMPSPHGEPSSFYGTGGPIAQSVRVDAAPGSKTQASSQPATAKRERMR